MEDKADVYIREKFKLRPAELLSTLSPRDAQGWYISRLNEWVICKKINYLNHIYLSR